MGVARSFRDLRVYQLARKAISEIFEVTKGFPREERREVTDQIRRSARATKALIAEGWARRRRYRAAFISKIDEDWEKPPRHNRGSMMRSLRLPLDAMLSL